MSRSVSFDDEDGPDVYATRDEAIAAAFADSEEGEEVFVHSPNCEMGQWADEHSAEQKPCNCTPEVHVVRKGKS